MATAYNLQRWEERLAERTDLSSRLTHLTRETESRSVIDVLLAILRDGCIRGSDPETTYIHGSRRAACFQDAPLSAICQNVYFEEYREQNGGKVRYRAAGLMFDKRYIYEKGGRPVTYDNPADLKRFLPQDQWWRIVNLDLSDKKRVIDWTHEREWRVPDEFAFDVGKATVLLPDSKTCRRFLKLCTDEFPEVLFQLQGIVVMSNILF